MGFFSSYLIFKSVVAFVGIIVQLSMRSHWLRFGNIHFFVSGFVCLFVCKDLGCVHTAPGKSELNGVF